MSSRLLTKSTSVPALSYAILLLFLVSVFLLGIANEFNLVPRLHVPTFTKKKDQYDFPDFNRIIHHRTLSEDQLGLSDPDRRLVVIGDVHGMNRSLHNLLSELSYSPESDTLVFAGDVLAKSSHKGSLAVLDFLVAHRPGSSTPGRIYPVRGNHDQMVVQWRAWRDWFELLSAPLAPADPSSAASLADDTHMGKSVHTGREFLWLVEMEWRHAQMHDPEGAVDPDAWADVARKRARGTWRAEWWRRIPAPGKGRTEKDWMIFSDHYWLARDLTREEAEYLYSLPLVLHAPSLHMFVVHAGLLPSDPKRTPTDARQPLAHTPDIEAPEVPDDFESEYDAGLESDGILGYDDSQDVLLRRADAAYSKVLEEQLRTAQEKALLRDISDNRVPWVLLNMRGVRRKGKVTRSNTQGRPWSKLWNEQIGLCSGFSNSSVGDSDDERRLTSRIAASVDWTDDQRDAVEAPLSCMPSTVIYGHAATRGLDIKRWSVGVDTGCLYGRKLTGLVLRRGSSDADEPDDEDDDEDEEDDEDTDLKKKPKSWRKRITFGDDGAGIRAQLVSIKCPKAGDLA
ncbi:Metallo-dependent phosphatase-like protein [Amylocystis lapponica]|nr:Metallo-dependent phosphatase-like protein [Amylocystis lapponica]